MSWSSPWLLVLGLVLVAALGVGIVLAGRRRSAALAAAGYTARSVVPLGRWLTVAGVVVLVFAVAGPSASLPVGRSAGTVILAMDVSNSMSATDVSPSRLAAAQQAAKDFIAAQPDSVDIGVVGFDQGALATSLPTADHAQATSAIDALRISGGTSLAAAILGSMSAITGKTVSIGRDGSLPSLGYWGSATIVLFSDGEDQGQSADAAENAATVAQNAGVHIETVGIGTAAGANVTVNGYSLHTALDADELTAIAQTTGGSYHPVSATADLNSVASGIDLRLTVADQQVPLAGVFIAVAMLLLVVGAGFTVARTGRLV
jgi:Ca-activated chloride channel homolog